MSEKKVGKRLLTWVLVLVMTLSLLPLNVLAANPAVMRIVRPDTDKYITYNFYLNEGDKTPYYSQSIKNNESLDVPATPEKEGYKFDGWYNGDEQFTTFGTPISVTADSTDVNLYAKFVPVCYVYFMDGTGSDARIIATEMLTPEGSLSSEDFDRAALLVPVGAEQAVIGWTKDDEQVGEVSYVEGGSIYLYPIIANGHWITFDSKGGSYVEPQFVTDTTKKPTPPAKPGYDFAGWYTNEETNNEFEFGNILSNNLTLYAKWTPNNRVSYTVIHWWENANDDGYSFHESKTEYGKVGATTSVSAERYNGFTAQTINQETIAGDGSTIVNVYYKRNVYTVKFYSYSSWVSRSEEYTNLRITAKYGANISDKWPTYDGSRTWSTNDSKNEGPYQVNLQTMPLGGANFYGPKTGRGSETAYYYVESLTGGKYELHHSDTTPGTGYSVTDEDRYPITGFTFKTYTAEQGGDWFNGYYEKYDGARFYYTRNSYNIVFINGGNTVKTENKKYQQDISTVSYTPTAPAGKDGYVFDGWFDNELCEGTAYDFANKIMPAQNITVYARWVAPVHKVEFVVDNSVVTEWTKPDVAHNSTISGLPTPTSSTGDTFLGWVDANGKPFHPSTKITGDLKLYAKFGNKSGYGVKYVTEGSSPVTDDKLYAEGAYATVRDGASTAPAGKVFLYWNASSDSSGKKYYPNDKVLVPKGGVTLTAVYGPVARVLTLTYHANYPEGLTAPDPAIKTRTGLKNNECISVDADDTFPPPAGYAFDGWNTEADGTGTSFAAGSSARVDKVEPNVLYAQWEKTTIDDEVIVTITGNSDTKVYNGSEQSVIGYTTDVGDKAITVTLKETGKDTAKGTDVGTYSMGLTPESFTVTSSTYTKIKVVVNDGKLEITPITDEVTVTINGNTDTKVYNASEQSVSGYTTDVNGKTISVALKEGSKAEAKGTDKGTYYMGLTKDDFTVTSKNYSNIKVLVNDGYLDITPVTDEVTVTITGNTKTVMYNGSEQSVSGYTTDVNGKTISVALKEGSKAEAKGTDVGKYDMGLTTNDFAVTSTNYTNIKVIVIDGWLEITPITETATVTITGNHNSVKYNGREQSVTGFTYTAPEGVTVALRDSKAEAKGTDKGTYYMGLTKDDFTVSSEIYKEFEIIVNDGYLEITRSGGHHPRPKPTVEIEDDDALGLNTTDHFAYIVGYGNGEVRPQNNITRAEVATIFFRLLTDDVRDENLTKTNRYSDVTRADWYNTAVSTLSSMGIITGYPDGTFRPNAAITRAEFAAITARFDNDGDKTAAKFSDIATHWAKDEISIAYNNGWINGYPNGTFGPQRDITRAETMTLVNRVLNRQPETEDDLLPNMTVWTDNANPNAWYYLAVQEATNSHYYKFKTNSKYEKWTELRETRDWTLLEK